ncbi:MAG TPA: molybdate ABC transporter substrate-binding protein [Rhizomicrobium sp.]
MWALTALFVACLAVLSVPVTGAAQDEITVFAAASLTNALQDVDAAYGRRTGVVVKHSFASSSTLARQIEAGAPAQVFLSADAMWMDYLARKNLIDSASRRNVLGNQLVLIAPKESRIAPRAIDARIDWLKLLGPDGRLSVGDPDHVPAGIYAREALQNLGAWRLVAPQLARAEDVRGALTLVERGEAPLGIVYATDARISDRVKSVGVFPDSSHSPIVYPFALVKGQASAVVLAYYRYLTGSDALAVFRRYGFSAP